MTVRTVPFFLFVLGWTWAFHVPLVMQQWPTNELPYGILVLLGGLGPPLGALVFVLRAHNAAYVREYVDRILSARRVPLRWWLLIFVLPFAVVSAGVALSILLGGASAPAQLRVDGAFIARVTPFYIGLMLLAPLLEEVAWRGYGQDSLQRRFGLVFSSLILGLVWWFWHLPLFFMVGTYQSGLGVGTVAFWDFAVGLVATSLVMTWLYNKTNGSILGAVVYHFLLNVANELILTDLVADISRTALQLGLGLFVLLVLPRLGRWRLVANTWRPAGAPK
jgi:uncharacterized protein